MRSRKSTAALSRSFAICRKPTLEPLESRDLLAAIAMTDEEQLLLELINWARANPEAEAIRFGIGLNDGLPPGTISAAPKPPLAPNSLLFSAAGAHSQDMIDRDFFDHVNPSGEGPWDRIAKVGYPARAWAENIASHLSASDAHEALFGSAGHRLNLLRDSYREIGVGVRERFPWEVIVTEVFATRLGNPFLTGVAFSDAIVADDFFSVGEGLDGVTITATATSGGMAYTTTTGPSGGYSLPVPYGTYDLTAAGGELARPIQIGAVVVGTVNVKVDFVVPAAEPGPLVAADDRAMAEKGKAVVIDVLQNDSGGILRNPAVIEIATLPSNGQITVDASTGCITYSPAAGRTGLDEFRYRVQGFDGEWSPPARAQVTVVDLADHPWRNPERAADVNADDKVAALDALLLIGHLNMNQPHALPLPSPQADFPPAYWDVTGDGIVNAQDVLAVINCMNRHAEGEASPAGNLAAGVPLPATAATTLDAAGTTVAALAGTPALVPTADLPAWPALPVENPGRSATADLLCQTGAGDKQASVVDDLLSDDLTPLLDTLLQ